MKICICVNNFPQYNPGGTERRLYEVAKELVSRGYDVTFTTTYFSEDQPEVDTINGVKVLSYGPKPSEEWGGIRMRKNFMKTIWAEDADIYINGAWSNLTGLAALVAKAKRSKFLYLSGSQNEMEKGWQDRPLNRVLMGKTGLYLADKIISHSKDLDSYMKSNLYKRKSRFEWFYHGYSPPETRIKDKEKRVIWLARFRRWKQPEKFLDIVKEIEADGWQFDLIGYGDQEYQEKLKSICAEKNHLNFVGRVEVGEDWEWYKKSSLFVNTSKKGFEGFPNSFIQSWLCGTPVISLNCDPDDLIEESNLGYKPESEEDMRDKIEYLLRNPKKLEQLQERCKTSAGEKFSIDRVVDRYEEIFSIFK